MAGKLTKEACRAARALLGMTTQAFAARLGVSPTTINGIEAGNMIRESTERRLLEALDELGVEITNGDGTGARIRLGRLDLHRAFEEIVVAVGRGEESPGALAICRAIKADARVTSDLMPEALSRDVADLDRGKPPGTYGQGARRLIALLQTRDATR